MGLNTEAEISLVPLCTWYQQVSSLNNWPYWTSKCNLWLWRRVIRDRPIYRPDWIGLRHCATLFVNSISQGERSSKARILRWGLGRRAVPPYSMRVGAWPRKILETWRWNLCILMLFGRLKTLSEFLSSIKVSALIQVIILPGRVIPLGVILRGLPKRSRRFCAYLMSGPGCMKEALLNYWKELVVIEPEWILLNVLSTLRRSSQPVWFRDKWLVNVFPIKFNRNVVWTADKIFRNPVTIY